MPNQKRAAETLDRIRLMDSCLFILLGATGDLATRKLIPSLYRGLAMNEPDATVAVLGVGRSKWDDAALRDAFREALKDDDVDSNKLEAWCEGCLRYQQVNDTGEMEPVFKRAAQMEKELGLLGNRIYYLAIPPSAFEKSIREIGEQANGNDGDGSSNGKETGWTRLVIEKPFGHDLASARALNALIHKYFDESEVYRIDHYLGKETVQNLLVFRFANSLFESLWNRAHIERVEITVAETIGVEGRAGYFDTSGTLRDMIQNHLTQLLTLLAMEPPARFDADSIRREKVKVLHSITPPDPEHVVLGQYSAANGEEGYRDHKGTPQDSTTETFAALRMHVENWRWQGVPFLLRTGKRLAGRLTAIDIYFRSPPVQLFGGPESCAISRNVLRIKLQPEEGFTLTFEVKKPGDGFDLSTQQFDFDYEKAFGPLPTAYETLLADVVAADQTLFVHADETEAAWALYESLLEADLPVHDYESGTWGPTEATNMFVTDYGGPTQAVGATVQK